MALARRDLLVSGQDRSADRLWLAFAASSVIFLVVLAISPFKDFFREYRKHQNEYRRILAERAASRREFEQAEGFQVGIRQIWIPDLDNHVDRCVSCHLGVDHPGMAGAPRLFARHPRTPHTPDDFDRFGCVACHGGQGRATTLADAHGDVPDWDTPLVPLRYTEAACGRCHLDDAVPEASLLSRGRALMERAGCYGCHELAEHEDWQGNAPRLDGLSQKTHPEWLRAWLREPQRLRPGTWMPDFELDDQEVEALVAFLWTRPPIAGPQLEPEESLPPGDPDRGKKLFRESRCISCHTVEGRGNGSAPELAGVGSKVSRAWLVTFLRDPHAFQPDTAMPRYAFTREDLRDITRYMMDELVDPSAPKPGPPPRLARKLVEEGEKVYRKYGCGGCHRIAGRKETARIGPELNGIGDKPARLLDFGRRDDLPPTLPDWLAAKIMDPRSFRPELKMPRYALALEQLQALVAALIAVPSRPVPEGYRVPASRPSYEPPGRFGELMSRYRCLSCHEVQGAGGDISTAPLGAEGSKVHRDWLRDYLLTPTTIRPLLTDRMVPLWMTGEEAAFMADFMANVYVRNDIPGEIFPQGPTPGQVERGRKLFYERYGCQSCHMLGSRGGYYGPLLDGLGRRLRSGWVYWWLRGPQRWRADVRCPDFGFEEGDARDLAAFVVSISGAPAGAAGGVGGAAQ